VADDIAQGSPAGFGAGFVVAGADAAQMQGQPVGCGDEKMAAAAGGIDDFY